MLTKDAITLVLFLKVAHSALSPCKPPLAYAPQLKEQDFRKRIFKLRLKKSPNNIFANDSHIKQKSLIARISNASTQMKDLSFSHGAIQVWRGRG